MALSAPANVFQVNVSRLTLLMKAQQGMSDIADQRFEEARAKLLTTHITSEGLLTAMSDATPVIEELQESIDTRLFSAPWLIAMLVTFAEAYLEDAFRLIIKASFDRAPDAIAQEAIECLVSDKMRGDAHKWITRMKKLGVTNYAVDLGPRMKKIWDLRHKVTHTAEPIIEGNPYASLKEALTVIGDFVMITDELVVSKAV